MRLTAVARFTIRVAGPAFVACATATAVAGPLSAQGIRGRVTEENTGPPLAGVAVSLHDNEQARVAGMTTGEAGDYEFTQLKPGTYWLRFRLPGFQPTNAGPISVAAGMVLEQSLELRRIAAVTLDTVVIEGERVPRYLEDFYRRKGRKVGSFLTEQDIERYRPARATDLVPRLFGFQLVYRADGEIYIRTRRPRGFSRVGCSPLLFVDGAYRGTTDAHDINDFIWVEDIAAIEAYDGPSRMPPEFNVTGSACGVIVVWTKR